MELGILRDEIDEIDGKIVDLYEKRMDICKQVAEYKIETGKKVFDRTREEEKIRKVKSQTHNEFNSHGVEELFEQIMSMSRKLQYQMLAEKEALVNFRSLVSMNWIRKRQELYFRERKVHIRRLPWINISANPSIVFMWRHSGMR